MLSRRLLSGQHAYLLHMYVVVDPALVHTMQLNFSAPRNFKQVVHVDLDYNWSSDGPDATDQFQLIQTLGEGYANAITLTA
jgi:hypothetical protein